jgi:hypothetical protein
MFITVFIKTCSWTSVYVDCIQSTSAHWKIEDKVVPVHDMKAYGEVEVLLHSSLTMAPDGREWSSSHPGCFTTWEGFPGSHSLRGGVSPKALEERRLLPLPGIKPPSHHGPAHKLVTIDWTVPAPHALILCLSNICFNIIYTFLPTVAKWSFL